MNQTSLGPKNGVQTPGSAPEALAGAGATESGSKTSPKYQAVLGPFTVRDVTVFGSTLLMFVGSLLPMFGGLYNLWNLNNLFFLALGIILPLVVTALFAARRLQPENLVRIGSLSIDQFASVVASFAATLFFLSAAGAFTVFVLVGLIGSMGLLVATVLAPHLPILRDDFKDRAEQPAHVVARESAIPTRKPAAPKPAKPGPGASGPASATVEAASDTSVPAAAARWAPAAAGPTSSGASGEALSTAAAAESPAETAAAPEPTNTVAESEPAAAAAAGDAAVVPAEPDVEPSAPSEPTEAADAGPDTRARTLEEPRHAPAATMATPIVRGTDNGAGPATQHMGTIIQPPVYQTIGATVDPATRRDESEHSAEYEAFWFAVAHPRVAVDEHSGVPVFTIEPGAWVLALEDRGEEFLVQDTDGKVGVLRDLSHIERG